MKISIEKLRQLEEDTNKKQKDLMMECDMLQGNINRMMVTQDTKELYNQYESACKRLHKIHLERVKELDNKENE